MLNRWVLIVLASFLGAAGCNNASIVKGKVIPGNLNFIVLVDERDERLKSDGLADVEVTARGDIGKVAGMVLGKAKSNPKGDFSLSIKEQSVLLKPVEFSATVDGHPAARETLSIPPESRRVLVIIKRDPASRPPPKR